MFRVPFELVLDISGPDKVCQLGEALGSDDLPRQHDELLLRSAEKATDKAERAYERFLTDR